MVSLYVRKFTRRAITQKDSRKRHEMSWNKCIIK